VSRRVPYRIDLPDPPDDALDILVSLGALDVELVTGGLAALLPDSVDAATVASALRVDTAVVSPAIGRDDGSTWVLSPRVVRAGGLLLAPAHRPAPPGALRLCDGPAFGTGLHPTTVLCLEALDAALTIDVPASVLDVGTGSGVLALAALRRGVPDATGLDVDPGALHVATENARLNDLEGRLRLVEGGPDAVDGAWPLVLANVLAAPLIEMAPVLVRRVAHRGRLVLSGIPRSATSDVGRAYRRLGMRLVYSETRAGWTMLALDASW
jgi:ribosomal protein L11 methyltransferase